MTGEEGEGAEGADVAEAGSEYRVRVPDGAVRMDLNTNLLGPNPAVERFLREGDFSSHLYPTADSDDLREALSRDWGVPAERIVCGNGVDEIISLCITAFAGREDIITYPTPSFSMYKFFAMALGCKAVEVPLGPDFGPDVDAFLEVGADLAIVASPNNPTGNEFPRDDLERLISESDGMVALDEAYVDFSGGSLMDRLDEFPNLMVFRTFSKGYAMAGMRVGAVAMGGQVERLRRIRPPFALNVVSEGAAIEALRHKDWLRWSVGTINAERPRLARALEDLGFRVYPSVANFLLCISPVPSRELCRGLAGAGVMIKDFGKVPTLENHVRITVGSREHSALLLEGLEGIL